MMVEDKGGKKRCSQDIGSPVTKATCCCSIGKSWGGRCESCPLPGTEEFRQLCPGGSGYRPNTTTVRLMKSFISNYSYLLELFARFEKDIIRAVSETGAPFVIH